MDLEQRSAQGARFRWGKAVPAVGEWRGSTRGSPRAGSKQGVGRPQEGSTESGGLGVLGSAAQGRMRAARGEQQHAGDGMAGERARKQREHARTRRA